MWKINFTIPTIGSPSDPYYALRNHPRPFPRLPPTNLFFKVVSVLAPNKTKEHKTNND